MQATTKDDPDAIFDTWYQEARARKDIVDASAMSVATVQADGSPSVRIVLLKAHDARGFVFYTHTESPKGRDMKRNPRAALCFHWAPLGRQVRVRGSVEAVAPKEADDYFASRPRLSQLGAWASRQSEPLASRLALEAAVSTVALRYLISSVPRPPFWSGYRVVAESIEFWAERPFRAHERRLYRRVVGGWESCLLSP